VKPVSDIDNEVQVGELAARLRVAVTRLFRVLRSSSPGGLSQSQWSALVTVEQHQPVRVGDIAEREGVSAPTATRLVASLEALELVAREIDPVDRRSAHVSVTEAGREKLAWARKVRTAVLNQRLSRLSAEDIQRVAECVPLLERLIETD
jgi:DNA-binding MarR family transcriptional regulator